MNKTFGLILVLFFALCIGFLTNMAFDKNIVFRCPRWMAKTIVAFAAVCDAVLATIIILY